MFRDLIQAILQDLNPRRVLKKGKPLSPALIGCVRSLPLLLRSSLYSQAPITSAYSSPAKPKLPTRSTDALSPPHPRSSPPADGNLSYQRPNASSCAKTQFIHGYTISCVPNAAEALAPHALSAACRSGISSRIHATHPTRSFRRRRARDDVQGGGPRV
jgi:hypothetical protein